MKKTKNAMKVLQFFLVLVIISASTNMFGAGITLLSPSNLDKCVTEGEISFAWDYDNPGSLSISDVVISIYKDTTILILSEALADDAVSYSLNTADIAEMESRFAYKWEISAKISGYLYKAIRYYYLIPTPKFGANSLPNDTHCIGTNLTLDWTPEIPEFDYFYEVQVSKHDNFDTLVAVYTSETSATMTLENNKHYYWRLRDINCPNNFSTVREFSTIHLPVSLLEPENKTQCEIVEDNGRLFTKLTWDSDTLLSNVDYKLEIRDAKNDTLILEIILQTNEYKLDITDLLDKEIKWKVQLVHYAGVISCNTTWSETYSFYTLTETPDIISPINENCVPLNAEFRWEMDIEDASYVEILISNHSTFTDTVCYVSSELNSKSAIIHLPEYSHQYFYKIRAMVFLDDTSYIYSLWSDVETFTTTIAGPKLVSPKNNTFGVNGPIELTWNNTPMVDSYRLDVCSDTNFNTSSKLYQTFDLADTFFVYPVPFGMGVDYFYWRVRGVKDAGSCYSDINEVRSFSTALEAPVAVYPANNDTTNNNDILFTWHQVNHATKYDLEYSTDKNALVNDNYSKITSCNNLVDTAFAVYVLNYGTDYYWRIKAKNIQNASSPWSEIYKFNTGNVKPNKVELVLPANNGIGNPYGLYTWKKTANANKYQVQISNDNIFTNPVFIDTLVSDTTLEFDCASGVGIYDNYYWRARGVNIVATDTTYSEWSDVWNFTNIMNQTPALLEIITPLDNTTTEYYDRITFSWNKVNGAKEYRLIVYIIDDDDVMVTCVDTLVKETQATVNKLNKNTAYMWRVMAEKYCLATAISTTHFFITPETSSILDNTVLSSMSIVPNPATNNTVLKVNTIETGTASMVITDISGSVVLSNNIHLNMGDNIINIDTAKLLSGNYMLSLYLNGKLVGSNSLVIVK